MQPPNSTHLKAAHGWLELGNYQEAFNELEEIEPEWRIAQVALRDVDMGLVDAINEYRQAKQIMPRGLLGDAAKAWVENNADVKRVSFRDAAAQYIRVRKKKVSEHLAYEGELRMNRFCAAFSLDVLDLTKAASEMLLNRVEGPSRLRTLLQRNLTVKLD